MEELCHMCNKNTIMMVKRPLCKSCYRTCHVNNTLDNFPIYDKRETFFKNLIEKYGESIIENLYNLKTSDVTLAEIGKIYSVSRERIRQIYNLAYDEKYTKAVNVLKKEREDREEERRKENLKIENKINRYKKGTLVFDSLMSEFKFYNKCKELGYSINHRGFGKHIYDADVNGLKIEIKMAGITKLGQEKQYYRFCTHDAQFFECDIIAVHIPKEDFWYILPKNIIGKSGSFYIPIDGETGNGKYKMLQDYRNAWHLLKNKEELK